MAKIAFCGVGQMGEPMAARLIGAGHEVAVWNRTASKTAPLVERGARLASSPADAASRAEVAFTMLATPEAVREVVLGRARNGRMRDPHPGPLPEGEGDDGLAAGLPPGAVLVEMSTVGPAIIHELAAALGDRVEVVDVPVLGSIPQAREGSLQLYFGGESATLQRLQPILSALGTPRHVGPRGSGAALKLAVNSTLGAAMCAIGEALALAQALGVDKGIALDALEGSPLGATVKRKRALLERGEYPPNFKLALAEKDLRLVNAAARDVGLELSLAEQAEAAFARANRDGLGELDYSAIIASLCGWEARR